MVVIGCNRNSTAALLTLVSLDRFAHNTISLDIFHGNLGQLLLKLESGLCRRNRLCIYEIQYKLINTIYNLY